MYSHKVINLNQNLLSTCYQAVLYLFFGTWQPHLYLLLLITESQPESAGVQPHVDAILTDSVTDVPSYHFSWTYECVMS